MTMHPEGTPADPAWSQYPADSWADAVVTSMKLGGVERLFFVSGSELSFYQEAVVKAQEMGRPAPRMITVTHEGVALNAALGDSMIRGAPAATAAHVDVGTLNYGAAIHTAWRGNAPVLMTAGAGPRAYPGSMPGGREGGRPALSGARLFPASSRSPTARASGFGNRAPKHEARAAMPRSGGTLPSNCVRFTAWIAQSETSQRPA